MALKTGSEDKKKVVLVIILGIVVLALVVRTLLQVFSNGTPPPPLPPKYANAPAGQSAQPSASQPAAAPQAAPEHEAKEIPGSLASLDPTLHPEWMAAAESLKYEGTGRNIFSMSSVPVHIEKPQGPIRPGGSLASQLAQGPPPLPTIDLKFFGYESHPGGARKVFLLHGDDVFIASQGDVVDHRYKIVRIAPLSITVEDIPYNNTQTLPLINN
ncbi:MAG TPA: hypothetical protein VMU92_09275 [Acidobacteriaceae bacterium]|nr:hypothetical protein [Acidobacteriaceae bacterium]